MSEHEHHLRKRQKLDHNKSPSVAATKVFHCTQLRLLIQSFTEYTNEPVNQIVQEDGTAAPLGGGWKLAHMCRTTWAVRVQLMVDLKATTLGQLKNYLYARGGFLTHVTGKDRRVRDKNKIARILRAKAVSDIPVLAVQVSRWLELHTDELLTSDEEVMEIICAGVLVAIGGILRAMLDHYSDHEVIANQHVLRSIENSDAKFRAAAKRIRLNFLAARNRASDIERAQFCEAYTQWIQTAITAEGLNVHPSFVALMQGVSIFANEVGHVQNGASDRSTKWYICYTQLLRLKLKCERWISLSFQEEVPAFETFSDITSINWFLSDVMY